MFLKVVLISVFDGIGGLRRSLQRLQVQVVLMVCVELEASLRRCVRASCPGFIRLSDMRAIERKLLEKIVVCAAEYNADLCVYGGGFPGQDVSFLAANRVGVFGDRSSLFREPVRLGHDLEELSPAVGLQFLGMAECARMEKADEQEVAKALN